MGLREVPDPAPLVRREALDLFIKDLVERFAPEQVILFGSQARGEARWDSDADILVVMPFAGRTQDTVTRMLESCKPAFPLDLHLRRPEELAPRYGWGDPYICEALDHGELLHGDPLQGAPQAGGPQPGEAETWPQNARAQPLTPSLNPVVREWIARAERHWRMAELLPDLPPGYLSGLFQVQRSLETYLRAALIAQGVPSRKCRDLQVLSDRLREPIPGWQPDPVTLNLLTQAALAYLDPGEHLFEPSQDVAWALAEAGPLRDSLRRWFASLEEQPQAADTQELT